jgi:carboxymethylenebutenolidase
MNWQDQDTRGLLRAINFNRPDGKSAPGYIALPRESVGGGAGIVLVEEWWGVNDQIKQVASNFALAGHRVVIPDFFRGSVTTIYDEALHQMEGLDFGDATAQDVRGAAAYLKRTCAKVAVIGYCMGGAVAILSAMQVPEIDAIVSFYGAPPPDAGDPKEIRVPALAHWPKDDEFFSAEIEAIEARLADSSLSFQRFWYDAPHGFCNPNQAGQGGLGHYDPKAASLAWERTLDFLRRTLA